MKNKARMTRLEGQIRHLYYKLCLTDKLIIGLFLVILIISLIGTIYKYINTNKSKPAYGGTLVEGIVAKSNSEADTNLQNLTGMGLVRFDSKGNIVPGLAESYSISEDKKVYTFVLRKGLDGQDIAGQLGRKEELKDDTVTVDGNEVVLSLKAPFAPILANLTKPNLQPGPYEIVKRSQKDIILTPNSNFSIAKPYIQKIDVRIYPTQDDLNNAVKRGLVMAGLTSRLQDPKYQQFDLVLTQDDVLFFNLKIDPASNLEFRKNLANGKRLDKKQTLVITLPDDKRLIGEFKALQQKYKALNVDVKSNILPSDRFADTVDSRTFQALLVGIDYGRDPDPYPFFHSSQIDKGQNLAGFKFDPADKLLEKARLTTILDDRQKLYSDFDTILKDQVPAIFLQQIKLKYEVSPKVKGIKIGSGVTNSDRFSNIWQWYLKTQDN